MLVVRTPSWQGADAMVEIFLGLMFLGIMFIIPEVFQAGKRAGSRGGYRAGRRSRRRY
jgi:hypothetical protein